MASEIESFAELAALCLQQYVDPSVPEAFRKFLLSNGDDKWLIASDYHMEKNDQFENYVSVFTVFPGGKNSLDVAAMAAGLPTKLSQSTVTEADLAFLKNLNHFTFIFISDKKFRAAAPSIEAARKSIDKSIENMKKWKNASQCTEVIAEFEKLREKAKAIGFNLKLFNHAALSASFVAAISLIIHQTLRVKTIFWLSDRDAMIDNLDHIVYTMFRLNMNDFVQKFKLNPLNLLWLSENKSSSNNERKKPLELSAFIRVPDYFAAPVAAAQLSSSGVQHLDREKYQKILAYVVADNPKVAVLRLVSEPGWGLHKIHCSISPIKSTDRSSENET